MNIAIIGYGKVGREIARTAEEKGHTIGLIIDLKNASDLNKENLANIDVAIEFSAPSSAFENILTCIRSNTPVVSGTTGWLDKWDDVVVACNESKGGLFYASNFSIGVNILFSINEKLAEIMNDYPEYKVMMDEVHHIHKLDAPSGTAISLAKQVIDANSNVKDWSLEKKGDGIMNIKAQREGEINGYHSIIYDSEVDTISISHNAKSRKGFASGAVLAAEFMHGKIGIYGMKDLLNL